MSESTTTSYSCDRCGRKCEYHGNSEVVFSRYEGGPWSRFHVQIITQSGMNNDSEDEYSDLCKSCAIMLFLSASKALRSGLDDNLQPIHADLVNAGVRPEKA